MANQKKSKSEETPKGYVSRLVYSVLAPKTARSTQTISDLVFDRTGEDLTEQQVGDALKYMSCTGFARNTKPGVGGPAAGENWVRA
ncbi:MAG: hypothetical protein HY376_00595 [Candidatus Blackburnbacteria bacterium]|nr:hypothetical protein [Candidatus Blackburnbacteria bacterium]